jgi:transposase
MNESIKKLKTNTSDFEVTMDIFSLESDQLFAQTARDWSVTPNTTHTWINKYSKPKAAIERTGENIYDEKKLLHNELTKITQNRDLLIKASEYFAKEILKTLFKKGHDLHVFEKY